MSKLVNVRKALRNRIEAAMNIDLPAETLEVVEDIAYNSVQSHKPALLRRLMIESLSSAVVVDQRTVALMAEIPFLIAAEMGMVIVEARQAA